MEEKISIIVVSFNSESTIEDTLLSIVKQTYKNIELIISDDASKDNTVSIAKKWIEKNWIDRPYRIVENTSNRGVPANCNKGLQEASANLVKFIAADDILLPNAIENYYSFYINNDINNICISKLETFGSDINKNQTVQSIIDSNLIDLRSGNQYKKLLKNNLVPAPSVGILNKKLILKIGAFEEKYKAFEDYPLYLKLSQLGYKFKIIDEKLVLYRISGESLTQRKDTFLFDAEYAFYFDYRLKNQLKQHMYLIALKQVIHYKLLKIKNYFIGKEKSL